MKIVLATQTPNRQRHSEVYTLNHTFHFASIIAFLFQVCSKELKEATRRTDTLTNNNAFHESSCIAYEIPIGGIALRNKDVDRLFDFYPASWETQA